MWPWVILMIVGAYVLGSVPTSYIAGRLLKGVDIRDYGSGTVSGSNVFHTVARWAVVPVGILDVSKGLAPVAVAALVLHFPIWSQGAVGLAAIAGHNWSIFLRFSGGRGLSTMIGALAIIAPWELAIFVVLWVLILAILKNSPLGALAGAVTLPLSSLALREPWQLTVCLVGVLLLLVAKRLLAELSTPGGGWKQVLVCRLLLDRDVADRAAWVHRPSRRTQAPPKEG